MDQWMNAYSRINMRSPSIYRVTTKPIKKTVKFTKYQQSTERFAGTLSLNTK